LLLRDSHSGLILICAANTVRLLGNVEFDVAVGGEIRRNTTMGSVCSSSAIDSSLGAHVGDSALFWVKRLSQGIRLQVIEEVENVLARLLWPSTVGVFKCLALGVVTGSSSESPEWNDGFVGDHILHVFNGLEQVQSSARSGGFVRVLKVSSQIINSALSRLGWLCWLATIFDHCK